MAICAFFPERKKNRLDVRTVNETRSKFLNSSAMPRSLTIKQHFTGNLIFFSCATGTFRMARHGAMKFIRCLPEFIDPAQNTGWLKNRCYFLADTSAILFLKFIRVCFVRESIKN